jgi:hypothetical protein
MRRLLAVGTLALLAACNPGAISDVDPFIGLYNLVSVDGTPLPVAGSNPGANPRLELVRVDVILKADHSATRVEFMRSTPAGRSSVITRDERSGSFALNGGVITISFPGIPPYTGSIGGELMHLTQGETGQQAVQFYRRERIFE